MITCSGCVFLFSSRRRHTRFDCDWSSDVCSSDLGGRSVGVTMLGQTTPGVMHLRDALELAGWEAVIFHANGVGGPAMEALARQGALAGVVDYTLSELANSLMDGIHATGPDRLTVAGEMGLPQVVV